MKIMKQQQQYIQQLQQLQQLQQFNQQQQAQQQQQQQQFSEQQKQFNKQQQLYQQNLLKNSMLMAQLLKMPQFNVPNMPKQGPPPPDIFPNLIVDEKKQFPPQINDDLKLKRANKRWSIQELRQLKEQVEMHLEEDPDILSERIAPYYGRTPRAVLIKINDIRSKLFTKKGVTEIVRKHQQQVEDGDQALRCLARTSRGKRCVFAGKPEFDGYCGHHKHLKDPEEIARKVKERQRKYYHTRKKMKSMDPNMLDSPTTTSLKKDLDKMMN
eukprot:CAMPEP_0117423380 /NCGR_PEP_ID=MMETSP0758-20121206/4012_1 /TAXON_ID=63605 /ORGANISM="Percolomonas cosmopolitus, Strain AE-1 (ATCC 50343)" /LENGTH=268 /DNA_ID=CAMNT_0005206527 /DNA_START=405 /DNA_END=1211 /DNA_ORIENTATION=+